MNKVFIAIVAVALCLVLAATAQRSITSRTSFRIESRNIDHVAVSDASVSYRRTVDLGEFIPQVPDESMFPGADLNNYPEDEEVSSVPPEDDRDWIIPVDIATQRALSFTLDGQVYSDERQISLDATPESSRSAYSHDSDGYRSTESTSRRSEDSDEAQSSGFRDSGSRSGSVDSSRSSSGFRSSGTRSDSSSGGFRPSGGRNTPAPSRSSGGGFRDGSGSSPTRPTRSSYRIDPGDIAPIDFRRDPSARVWTDPSLQVAPECKTGPCMGLQTSLNLSALSTTLRQLIAPVLSAFNGKNVIVRNSWPRIEFTLVQASITTINLFTSGGRVNVQLGVSVTGALKVRTRLLGKATSTFNIVNYVVSASAATSVQNSKISLANVNVTAGYQDLKIHTSGGLIMKFILRVATTLLKVKSLCRNILTQNVPDALRGSLATAAANMIGTIPWKLPIGKWGAGVSLNVMSLDTTRSTSVVVGFDAQTINFATGQPFPHQEVSRQSFPHNPTPTHLFGVQVDPFVFNDYISTWISQQPQVRLFHRQSNPSWLTQLTTAAWNTIFPGIGTNHPNANLVLKVNLHGIPSVKVDGSIATFSAAAVATWHIDGGLGDAGLEVVSLKLDVSGSFTLNMKYDQINQVYALTPSITNITTTFSTVNTIIGPIDMTKVNETLNNIFNFVVSPILNIVLSDGVPIPTTKNFQVINPVIGFANNAIVVGTGVNISF